MTLEQKFLEAGFENMVWKFDVPIGKQAQSLWTKEHVPNSGWLVWDTKEHTWMAEDITFTDYKSKSKVCQQIQFTSQRFDANFRMTNRLINGHPFDADGGM